ncbi:MAG: hypothetical protein ACKO2K_09885 [Alphaproteobacteria bacterium]
MPPRGGSRAFVPPAGHVQAARPTPAGPAATPAPRARPPAEAFSADDLTPSQRETALALLKVRLYRVLWKHEPRTFGRLVREVDASKRAHESPQAMLLVARSRVMPLVRRHVAHAEARTLLEYVGNLLIEIRKVAPQAGDACYALLAADDDAALRLADVDLGTLDDFGLDRLADAVKQSLAAPVPLPPLEDVAADLHRTMSSVELRFGPDATILARIDQPRVDRKRVCEVAVAVYGGALGRVRNPSDSVALLRWLVGQPTTDPGAETAPGPASASPGPAPSGSPAATHSR